MSRILTLPTPDRIQKSIKKVQTLLKKVHKQISSLDSKNLESSEDYQSEIDGLLQYALVNIIPELNYAPLLMLLNYSRKIEEHIEQKFPEDKRVGKLYEIPAILAIFKEKVGTVVDVPASLAELGLDIPELVNQDTGDHVFNSVVQEQVEYVLQHIMDNAENELACINKCNELFGVKPTLDWDCKTIQIMIFDKLFVANTGTDVPLSKLCKSA